MMYKCIKFRKRVVKAQQMLAHYKTLIINSLSTLVIKVNDPVSIDSITSDKKIEFEIKDELICNEDNLDTDYNPEINVKDPIEDVTNDQSVQSTNSIIPIRVYAEEYNIQTNIISRNPLIEEYRSESKAENTENNKDGSETETADESEDEVKKPEDNDKKLYKMVRVDKNKMLEVMSRARIKMWFVHSKLPKCKACVMLFKNKNRHKEHLKKHELSSGAHACELCQQRFTTIERATKHEEEHLTSCVECIECHELFASSWDFSVHHNQKHSKKDIKCHTCIQVFSTVHEYRLHRREVHNQLCTCDYCGRKYRKCYLVHHIKTMHMETQTKCSICNKMIKGDRKVLLTHLRRVHKPTVLREDCYCVECDRVFPKLGHFNYHVKVFHENFRSECPICGKLCTQLSSHMMLHSNEYKHPCPQCDKKFKDASNLKKHMKFVHSGYKAPRNQTCEICQKSFTQKKILSDHMNTHTGERPYVCKICGDTFGHKAALYTHNKLKHKSENKNKCKTKTSKHKKK